MSVSEAFSRFATVAVPVPLRRLFTYGVGETLAAALGVGDRVRVPFGGRTVVGTVVDWPLDAPPDPDVRIKPVQSILPGGRRLRPAMLELTRFTADYYLCSWGEAIETALPPDAGPSPPERMVRRLAAADPEALRRLRQKALNHSAVGDALEVLEGEIVEIQPLPGGGTPR